MNSPNLFNYELRPAKFTERKMLLASFANICPLYNGQYQYIGFGGLSFTDFKLFHKELHISDMHSIEGGNKILKERIEFNKPYEFINLYTGLSTKQLANIDLTKKSIIWLDYDNDIDPFMFEDILLVFNKLPKGSIYLITCNRQLKNKETNREYTVEEFKEKFGDLAPFELENQDFMGERNYLTLRKMFIEHINSTLKERRRLGDRLFFHQLYNFLYQEKGGAMMYSFGGIIEEENFNPNQLNLNGFDFIKTDEHPYRIKIPNITQKEIDFINTHINDRTSIVDSKVVDEKDLDRYLDTYKYMPNFMDVRH